jgi:hypothetical protein
VLPQVRILDAPIPHAPRRMLQVCSRHLPPPYPTHYFYFCTSKASKPWATCGATRVRERLSSYARPPPPSLHPPLSLSLSLSGGHGRARWRLRLRGREGEGGREREGERGRARRRLRLYRHIRLYPPLRLLYPRPPLSLLYPRLSRAIYVRP